MLIDRDETALIQGHPGLVQADAVRVGHATGRHQDRLGGDRGTIREHQGRLVAGARRRLRAHPAHDPHARRLQAGLNDAGRVLLLAGQHVRARGNEGDIHAEGRHHRRELHADVAGPDDRQGGGKLLQTQDLLVRPRARLPQARNRRASRARPEVDEDALAADRALTAVLQGDAHRALAHETGLPAHEIQAGGGKHLLVGANHRPHDALLVGAQLPQVNVSPVRAHDAEGFVAAGIREAPRRVHQGLRRNAGDVDAGAAHEATLHHRHAPARLRALHRQRLAGLAASDDQQVDVFDRIRGHVAPYVGKGLFPQRARS